MTMSFGWCANLAADQTLACCSQAAEGWMRSDFRSSSSHYHAISWNRQLGAVLCETSRFCVDKSHGSMHGPFHRGSAIHMTVHVHVHVCGTLYLLSHQEQGLDFCCACLQLLEGLGYSDCLAIVLVLRLLQSEHTQKSYHNLKMSPTQATILYSWNFGWKVPPRA